LGDDRRLVTRWGTPGRRNAYGLIEIFDVATRAVLVEIPLARFIICAAWSVTAKLLPSVTWMAGSHSGIRSPVPDSASGDPTGSAGRYQRDRLVAQRFAVGEAPPARQHLGLGSRHTRGTAPAGGPPRLGQGVAFSPTAVCCSRAVRTTPPPSGQPRPGPVWPACLRVTAAVERRLVARWEPLCTRQWVYENTGSGAVFLWQVIREWQ